MKSFLRGEESGQNKPQIGVLRPKRLARHGRRAEETAYLCGIMNRQSRLNEGRQHVKKYDGYAEKCKKMRKMADFN
jgi:hypothetical protein